LAVSVKGVGQAVASGQGSCPWLRRQPAARMVGSTGPASGVTSTGMLAEIRHHEGAVQQIILYKLRL